nr:hypothetical protein [uncultured Steroidobacter sp.]
MFAGEIAEIMPRNIAVTGSCAGGHVTELILPSQCRGTHDFLNVPRKIPRATIVALFEVGFSPEIATKQCVARAASASTVRITHRYAGDLPFHAGLARQLLALLLYTLHARLRRCSTQLPRSGGSVALSRD